ncbi:MAG: hypothetical protein EBR82_40580 [Caulobacteraceae bacterium]|nr:hypothetical protein [Caulobacteraceae bacterium]
MPQFNLQDYETVADRLKRALKDHPDLRIVTHNITQQHDRAISTWVVYTEVFLNAQDQANKCPKATGLAFEVDGVGMAQKTSALETCETSSIGRALANMGYFGDKKASREEMSKTLKPATPKNYQAALENINDLEGLRALYLEAKQAKQSNELLDKIRAKADGLTGNTGKD